MIEYKTAVKKSQVKFMQELESSLPKDKYVFGSYPARDGKLYYVSGHELSIEWYARAPKIKSVWHKSDDLPVSFNKNGKLFTYLNSLD